MSLFRPDVDALEGYIPGEQPQEPGWVKLNTNENPYPPSPRVVNAIQQAAQGRLNVYPDPLGKGFCQAAADLFDLDPEWILPANGSDENLTIIIRAFADKNDLIAYPYPSYILYETLAQIQGTRHARLRLEPDWSWNLKLNRPLIEQSKILFVPNPNSPSGNHWDHDVIRAIVPPTGVLVHDEAYGDFVDQPHRMELLQGETGRQMIVTRTLSKSYSLAGIRFGFCVAHPDLIAGMRKVKDSYNSNTLSLAAAEAAIRDQDWMLDNRRKILATREHLTNSLTKLGFNPVPSQANFVWATHPTIPHKEIYKELKQRKILVRYMEFANAIAASDENSQATLNGLRITIGTNSEIETLIEALTEIVS